MLWIAVEEYDEHNIQVVMYAAIYLLGHPLNKYPPA